MTTPDLKMMLDVMATKLRTSDITRILWRFSRRAGAWCMVEVELRDSQGDTETRPAQEAGEYSGTVPEIIYLANRQIRPYEDRPASLQDYADLLFQPDAPKDGDVFTYSWDITACT